MKRYLLFGYDSYYPTGGWNDYIDSYTSPESARLAIRLSKIGYTNRYENYQIVDITSCSVVETL